MHDPTLILLASSALMAFVIILFLRRILSSPTRQVDKWLRQMEAGERPVFPPRTNFDDEIQFTVTGFSILPLRKFSDPACHGEWLSVRTVTAFKMDLITTDCVCLAFEFSDGSIIQAHEEMKGWLDLCEALPIYLPGTLLWEKWFMNIRTPAFAPCVTLLYQAGMGEDSKK
jgi:hypothetical protein